MKQAFNSHYIFFIFFNFNSGRYKAATFEANRRANINVAPAKRKAVAKAPKPLGQFPSTH